MAFKISTGLSAAILDSGSLRNALTNGYIKIYSGPVPANADASLSSATLLCTISLNSTGSGINLATSAIGRTITKATETWSGANVATGVASFFRHVLSGDDGSSSTTQLRIQGTAGASGTDMVLANATLTATETTTLDDYSVTMPGE